MTASFRNRKEAMSKDLIPMCETFDRDAFDKLLGAKGCQKVRIYFGLDAQQKLSAVIVGVDATGNDMIPANALDDTCYIVDDGDKCPEICPPPSDLNTI